MTISSDIVNQVQQLYVAYFNRPADLGGLNYWASVVAAQGSTAAVSAAFAKSPEYTTAFAGKSSYETVNQIYTNLFGRGAELGGLQYWGLLLDQGKITIDNAVTQIAAGAQGSDAIAYGNKVAAAGVFTTSLDSAGSALAYASAAAALVAKNFITSITDNASFTANTTPEAIATAVAALVTANESQSNTPQTLTLTANFDSVGFVPSATQQLKGNDTFISTNPGTTAATDTFNAFDNLDGGLGIDTFKIASGAALALPTTAIVKNIEIAEIQTASTLTADVSAWTGLTKLTTSSVGATAVTAGATTAVVVNEASAGATTIIGGSTVSVSLSGTDNSAISISKGAGALTFSHSGGGTGATSISTTAGNVTSTETGTTNGGLSIDKTTGNVIATRAGENTGAVSIAGTSGTVAYTGTSSATGDATGGAITVNGGTTINVTQATGSLALNKTFTNGTVTITGGATTTAVTVNNAIEVGKSTTVAGVADASVNIIDVNSNGGNAAKSTSAGTITSATVTGFSTLNIADTALTTLSVTGGTGNIIIDNTPYVNTDVTPNVTQPTATTLGLTINGQTGGTLDDADIYTTLNVTTAGTANSTLANITFGKAEALTVAGTKGLTLTSAAGLTALKTVTVSGSAGITADLSGATVTSVTTTATTGASTVTIDGSKATFTGGAGVDKVTVATGSTKTVTLGAGNDTLTLGAVTPTVALGGGDGVDTLSIGAAAAVTASGNSAFAGLVTGFESLILTTATGAQDVNVAVLGGFNNVTVDAATAVAGANLTLTGLPTAGILNLAKHDATFVANIVNTAFAAGASDTITLNLSDADGTVRNFGTVNAANVENFIVNTIDGKTGADGTNPDAISLGAVGKSITVAGNGGLDLTATSTALTNVDASGITLGGFVWESGALNAAVAVKGSATGTNAINFEDITANAIVTYTGGSGADTVGLGTIASTKAHTINLGGGTTNNTVNNGATANGANVVTSTATGTDTVTLGSGANVVNLGNGINNFTAGNGNNTYTGGTGVDTVTVGSGQNTLTLGTGNDIVIFSAVPTGVNAYSTVLDAAKGDVLTVTNLGTETFGTKISLASTAVFQDYANAVVAQGGNASVNGHFGWFQFAQTVGGVTTTDTYLVQSRHDGSGVNPAFVAGTDFIVKLTGVVDLSLVTGTGTNALTLG